MTCGNAGDVRKGISASKILRIPNLHIEQDIYNPIEMIAFFKSDYSPIRGL